MSVETPFSAPFRAIGAGFRIFIKYMPLFALAAAVFYLPLDAALALIPRRFIGNAVAIMNAVYGGQTSGFTELSASALYGALAYMGLERLFTNLFATCAAGAAAYITLFEFRLAVAEPPDELDEDKPAPPMRPTVSRLLEVTAGRAHLYFITALIITAVQIVGAPLFFVPAIYISVAAPFCECITADTGKWGFSNIMDNLKLTRRKWWATAWFIVVMFAGQLFITAFMRPTASAALDVALSAVSQFISFPFTIALCVLYCRRAYPNGNATEGKEG